MLAAKGQALVGLWMEGEKYSGNMHTGASEEQDDSPALVRARDWLDRYFAGEKPRISQLQLDPAPSRLRKAVWQILCGIPYVEVTAYGEIANKIARLR